MVSRDPLTVSHQQAGERVTPPSGPVNWHHLHECHHDHNEIEGHDSTPEYSQTLGSVMSVIKDGRYGKTHAIL